MRVGLIGFPVAHSKSPLMQGAAFRAAGLPWTYELWDTPHAQVAERVAMIRDDDEIAGANVTVPHKLNVMPHLDHISEHARAIGAVNTICKLPGQAGLSRATLLGDNTDWIGFLHDLEWHGVQVDAPAQALVLGAGGSARGIVYGLLRRNWQVSVMNRDGARAQQLVADMQTVFAAADGIRAEGRLTRETIGELAPALVVNCTSAGMEPNDDTSAWPVEVPFPKDAVLYDLVYKPRRTQLMRQAEAAGARVIGGIGMLAEQGAAAFEMWTGVPAQAVSQVMRAAIE